MSTVSAGRKLRKNRSERAISSPGRPAMRAARPHTELNRRLGVPLYRQLKEMLRDVIVAGQWREGEQIPPESELCATYGVSRITVRQAVSGLVGEGWLHREQGKGTFVRSVKPEALLTSMLFFQHDGPPKHVSARVRDVLPPRSVREALHLLPTERVLEITRVRVVDGRPSVLETGYLPLKLITRQPTQDELRRAYYYDILKSCTSVTPAHTRVVLEPILLDRNEARILHAPAGSAALKLERLTTSGRMEPVLLTRNVMAGDHSRYVLEFDVPATERESFDVPSVTARRRRET